MNWSIRMLQSLPTRFTMQLSWLKAEFRLSWLEEASRRRQMLASGALHLNQINQLHFDRAFIGMNGVDDGYYTTPDMEEGAVKRAILENAKQTYVLVDSSKIGQTCFAKVAPLKRAIVITSKGHELLQAIKEKTEVIEV